ncbi:hypothetical protein C8Q72DRAFT_795340 [Fomitopsis betulina]|nr:hypothetical protein C8Q72DRAFT_795340 [Fomitopsis betulina]
MCALSLFPTADEFSHISKQAYNEATSLIALTGLSPSQLVRTQPALTLPSISAWYTDPSDDEADSDVDFDKLDEQEMEDEARDLQRMLDYDEEADPQAKWLPSEDDQINSLKFAALATTIGDVVNVHSVAMPDIDDDVEADVCVEECRDIRDVIYASLPPVNMPVEKQKPLGLGDRYVGSTKPDKQRMVYERGAPTWHRPQARQQARSTAGQAHLQRWCEADTKAQALALTGNSLNAAATALANASKIVRKRLQCFTKADVLHAQDLAHAWVSALRPMRVEDYGVVLERMAQSG